MTARDDVERRLSEAAVRMYRRYAIEIVEGLVFCPYAVRAREDDKTREVVLTDAEPRDADVLEAIEALTEDSSIELALILLPRAEMGREDLGRWVEHLRKAHAAARGGTVMAIEGFHPDAVADLTTPERLTPFVRRTPDPTLQLTRLDALERVRRGTPSGTAFFDPATLDLAALLAQERKAPIHKQIAARNHETVSTLGVEEVTDRMDAILADRNAAYAAIDPEVPMRRVPNED
ncbi:MAG: DUF1415 family protein [Sandaracinaceae bacterium]